MVTSLRTQLKIHLSFYFLNENSNQVFQLADVENEQHAVADVLQHTTRLRK